MNNETNETSEKEMNIIINGLTFTTKEAFAKYREEHTFRGGDAVNVMVKEYGETSVCPGFIIGINDFGEGRVSLDVAYLSASYPASLKFGSVYSDTCEDAKSDILGVAPINEFNDLTMKIADALKYLENNIATKKSELASLERQFEWLKDVGEKMSRK